MEDEIEYDYKFLEEWEDNRKNIHTTLQDILNIPRGETKQYICLDRNWQEIIQNSGFIKHFKRNKFREDFLETWPGYFLSYTKSKDDDFKGEVLVYHIDKTGNIKSCKHEFHIEYKKNSWYPLMDKDGTCLPSKDEFGKKFYGPRHYEGFAKNTRVGWRGPIIEFKYFEKH